MKKKIRFDKGSVIKTSVSDKTVVIDYNKKDALLMTENQYIVAHNIYENNGKYEWDFGNYSDNLTEAFIMYNKDFDSRVNLMKNIADDNYQGYIKSIIAVEHGDMSEKHIDQIVNYYMDNDEISLLSDSLQEKINSYFNVDRKNEFYFNNNEEVEF